MFEPMKLPDLEEPKLAAERPNPMNPRVEILHLSDSTLQVLLFWS